MGRDGKRQKRESRVTHQVRAPLKKRRERSPGRYQEPVSRPEPPCTVRRKKRGVQRGPSKSTAVPRTRITNPQNGLITTARMFHVRKSVSCPAYPFRFSPHFLIPRRASFCLAADVRARSRLMLNIRRKILLFLYDKNPPVGW